MIQITQVIHIVDEKLLKSNGVKAVFTHKNYQLKDIMTFCGYEHLTISDEKKLYFHSKKKKEIKKIIKNKSVKKINKTNDKNKIKRDPNSPFAVLEKLL